ncbi:hypothetical protein FACS189442_2800 [Spirochaetia bacterium]|nr:hypothetical protein FACS189442_2800 [Spirochaetia bacterium]
MKPGTSYEQFVAKLQKAIIQSEPYTNTKNIQVEMNKMLCDKNGANREFDVYWKYELGGITYQTVIECKDYNSTIDITKIDALIGKIQDLPEINKALFATKTGYQKGAKLKAEQNNIDLLIIREQNDNDWVDSNGNHYLRYINILINGILPAYITRFKPIFDINWLKENTNIDFSKPTSIPVGDQTKLMINDVENNKKYSLYDMCHTILLENEIDHGQFTKIITLNNAYIYLDNKEYKITGYEVDYIVPKPIKTRLDIDYSNEFLGVIEYLQKGKKLEVLKNGSIRETDIMKTGGNK